MKRLSCLLLVLLCCLPAGAEDWTYDSGITLVDGLKAVGGAVVLSGMRGELLGENVARLEVWGAGEDALAVFEGVARPGGAAQDALYLGGDSFAVLSGAAGDHEALALEYVFAGETAWRSAAIPWASRIYAAGGCLLVNSFPMLDGARLLAFGREGTLLWTRDFDETVHFTDIFAAGDGFVACGWAQVGDKAYPRAIGLDAGGAEVWRYAATGPGETVAAGMDGADVLLLIDVDGGGRRHAPAPPACRRGCRADGLSRGTVRGRGHAGGRFRCCPVQAVRSSPWTWGAGTACCAAWTQMAKCWASGASRSPGRFRHCMACGRRHCSCAGAMPTSPSAASRPTRRHWRPRTGSTPAPPRRWTFPACLSSAGWTCPGGNGGCVHVAV